MRTHQPDKDRLQLGSKQFTIWGPRRNEPCRGSSWCDCPQEAGRDTGIEEIGQLRYLLTVLTYMRYFTYMRYISQVLNSGTYLRHLLTSQVCMQRSWTQRNDQQAREGFFLDLFVLDSGFTTGPKSVE